MKFFFLQFVQENISLKLNKISLTLFTKKNYWRLKVNKNQ